MGWSFVIGFSSINFNLLAGLFLLVIILSYLMGLSVGAEAVRMDIAGFVNIMNLIVKETFVIAATALNIVMRIFSGLELENCVKKGDTLSTSNSSVTHTYGCIIICLNTILMLRSVVLGGILRVLVVLLWED